MDRIMFEWTRTFPVPEADPRELLRLLHENIFSEAPHHLGEAVARRPCQQPTLASTCCSNFPRPPMSSASVPGSSAASGDIHVTSSASCLGSHVPVTGTR